MLEKYLSHNRFKENIRTFNQLDPHLLAVSQLKYQHRLDWWTQMDLNTPGIYILTGGRQIGKSTSCKLLIRHCLQKKLFSPEEILYLPCDEIFDAKELAETIRFFFNKIVGQRFLLIIDEITFVQGWERIVKALAEEGFFRQGLCLLTGSDTAMLKEAAMWFPGRRGEAARTDFHLYPLCFAEYVRLRAPKAKLDTKRLYAFFQDYLLCGGYLRAINDLAQYGKVKQATYSTYEQWIRGDFLKRKKNDDILVAVLNVLLTVGVSQISYSKLTQKIGLIVKETLIDYCRFLERMDILINLQAFDQNKKQGFPRKNRKFHFTDPFIYRTLLHWLKREGYLNSLSLAESTCVEACVASHCSRFAKTFYFKGQGEVDVIWLQGKRVQAIEVKWAEQVRANDLKMLKQFKNSMILTKTSETGMIENIQSMPVYQFLWQLAGSESF